MTIESNEEPPDQLILANEKEINTEKSKSSAPVSLDSPLTPTAEIELSTPHEPPRRRSLLSLFENLEIFDEDEDGVCYDSDGNEPPVASIHDSSHFETCCGDISIHNDTTTTNENITAAEFIPLDDSHIMSMKVDELKQQLSLRGLSKNGLKAELRDRLKKAMVDKVPIQDRPQLVKLQTDSIPLLDGVF